MAGQRVVQKKLRKKKALAALSGEGLALKP
jgi:hypothetical protein